jgi:hypothetical protein
MDANKILKECERLKCQIQDQSNETPKGYPLAISYRPIGHGLRFLVLGHDKKAIDEMAQFYAKTRYKGAAVEPIDRDQSFVGEVVKNQSGYKWQCIGVNPFSGYYCQRDGDQIPTTLENITL